MEKITKKIVPDTSVIISGILSDIASKEYVEIIIPEFVVEELRAQASRGREIGFRGLEELKKLRELDKEGKIKFSKLERRQTYEEIQLAKYGRIDALIMDVAKEKDAILYTSDMVQRLTAEAEGVKIEYFAPYEKKKKTTLSKMLTPDTMSLHLKEGTIPLAKRGKPGNFSLVKISDKEITLGELEGIIKEIMDAARYEEDSFVELGGHTASIVQAGDMRIAIARPPFSDGVEITVVRPITKLVLEDYKLSEKLKERLEKQAEGVLVAGPPGSGKSTFVASLAEFYESNNKIVKTMESPRDLQVKKEITQYSKLRGKFENTAEMLLLVRPDYTVFDEIRKTEDFRIYGDMRLSGIGMLGVVHATEPIDAIQRFIGRIEMGLIPHIIDTIIFIKDGEVKKVFCLSLTVRTPTGMTESDLARPVVEVNDFETNALEYEIYTYGDEKVVIPIKKKKESGLSRLAKKQIQNTIGRFDRNADIEIVNDNKIIVKVDNDAIPALIGKNGRTIKELEEHLGMSIEVAPKVATMGRKVEFEKEETGANLVFIFAEDLCGKIANFYSDEYIFSATIGRNCQIRVSKKSETGKVLLKELLKHKLKVFI